MEYKSGWVKTLGSTELYQVLYEDDNTENPWYQTEVQRVRSAVLVTDFNCYRCQLGVGKYDMRSDYRASSSDDVPRCIKRRLFKLLTEEDLGKYLFVETEEYVILPRRVSQSYVVRLTKNAEMKGRLLQISETDIGKYLTIEVDYLDPEFPNIKVQDIVG